ncbi:CRISPR-associated protein Csm4 [Persephonella hydrogeniphila]|uniref:CRISPR system Cms protein Csm4 n=1 Tax=Persephonella hydrogeniphila TaxID=198703 RepID=A0A285NHY1_9AQUI|nr:type III-A CRISPR-associated RAMP protein Csm4 [Persephonella hydrogeniphila]SNZ09090.1 CRISPR-associated protein Csm4 [Persephonella hydrogeniphila]
MNLYKIDITPYSLFKDLPSSYTIFGAISWAYSLLYGEDKLQKVLSDFENGNVPFIISSIFPREGKNYYFPKPNLKAKREENSDIDYKKLKKISYVNLDTLKKVLDGEIKTELELNKFLKRFLENESLQKVSLASKDSIPHASIDRLYGTTEGSGEFYFEEITAVSEGFILIALRDDDLKKELEAIFNLLQDIGLGGNRSIGYGKVRFSSFEPFPEIEKYFHEKTERFLTLSPVIPESKTYDLKDSYYYYFTFRGAVDNNYDFKNVDIWKEKVIYLKEGSTLKVKNPKDIYGQFYPAKNINGKKIFQYGLAFPLFIQGDKR